jgi:hypothetical protein
MVGHTLSLVSHRSGSPMRRRACDLAETWGFRRLKIPTHAEEVWRFPEWASNLKVLPMYEASVGRVIRGDYMADTSLPLAGDCCPGAQASFDSPHAWPSVS